MTNRLICAATAVLMLSPLPALAQDPGAEPASPESPATGHAVMPTTGTVFDGDWLTLGAGVAMSASYDGSDDYVFSPLPFLQGRLGGVSINPRAAGIALDFIQDRPGETGITLGVAGRLNRNRASQIEDEVVKAYGELDTAVEVGPTVGVSIPGVLHQFDSLSFGVDALWDVAGAHEGMTINPSITYFTPLSRGLTASFSLSAVSPSTMKWSATYARSHPVASAWRVTATTSAQDWFKLGQMEKRTTPNRGGVGYRALSPHESCPRQS